jgi:Transmembrane protein 33/Nucleoporin POM33
MSDSESARKYKEFNFNANQSWNDYLKTIDPAPTGNVLEKKKRQWYRDRIDPAFDIQFDASENPELHRIPPRQSQPSNSGSGAASDSPLSEALKLKIYKYESYLKFGFIIALILPIFGASILRILGIVINVIAIVRMCNLPNSPTFLQKLLVNDFFFNLLYVVDISFLCRYNSTIFYFPLLLHYLLGLSIFLTGNPTELSFIMKNQTAQNLIIIAKNSKDMLMETKCLLEVAIGLYILVLGLLGKGPLIAVIFYVPFLLYKKAKNPTMTKAITNFRTKYLRM